MKIRHTAKEKWPSKASRVQPGQGDVRHPTPKPFTVRSPHQFVLHPLLLGACSHVRFEPTTFRLLLHSLQFELQGHEGNGAWINTSRSFICKGDSYIKHACYEAISYPESSGFLFSGLSPEETLGNLRLTVLSFVTGPYSEQPIKKKFQFFPLPQSLSRRLPSDQKSGDSGYEIGREVSSLGKGSPTCNIRELVALSIVS